MLPHGGYDVVQLSLVRTIKLRNLGGLGSWFKGMNAIGRNSSRKPPYFELLTSPTIWKTLSASPGPSGIRNVRPTGFAPLNNSLANALLTIATVGA